MTRMFVATLLASALAATGASAQQAGSQSMGTKAPAGQETQAQKTQAQKMSAQEFLKEAASGGMFEVAAGKLAADNAEDQQVRKFGQRMVDDHTKANDQLAEVAKKINMTMPTAMESKHKGIMDELKKDKGEAFDRSYMKTMVSDHQKDVAAFQSYAQTGDNADLKQFAQTTLPVLQEHLQLAQEIAQPEKAEVPGASKAPMGTQTR